MKRLVLLGLLLPLGLGCSATGPLPPPSPATVQAVLHVAVTGGVATFLALNPDVADDLAAAATIAEDALDGGTYTSAGELTPLLQGMIPWEKLSPTGQRLIGALLPTLGAALDAYLVTQQIPTTDKLVPVRQVFTWIREAALAQRQRPITAPRVAGG